MPNNVPDTSLKDGDLRFDHPGEPNPHDYSFSTVDGKVTYFDDDGEPVNPTHRPITESDLDAASRAFKMSGLPRDDLAELVLRYSGDERFAGAVIAKAARRALQKLIEE